MNHFRELAQSASVLCRENDSDEEVSDGGLTDCTTVCPSENGDESEEMSLLQSSEQPFQFQFGDEGAYPWMNTGLEDPDDEILEREDHDDHPAQVLLAEGHWEHLQEELNHLSADDNSQAETWIAVTYGLSILGLGRRDVEFQRDSMQSLIQAIAAAWQDHLIFGDITV